jgi:dedicator of cytokinesis protein 3
MTGGAVIIRDPEIEDRGQIVDGEGSISPIALMTMQANIATTTPGPDSIDSMIPPTSPVKPFFAAEAATRPHPVLSHLFINMRAFVGSICSSAHEGVELMFALYVRHERHFISEFFLVELNHNGVPAGPRPEDLLGRIKTLFTDLTARDVADEVYLICRIFRIGEAKDVLRPETANSSTSSDKQSRASMLFDMARPGSSGRLHKSTSSIIRSKGSRVSQIFTRSTSPDGQNPPNPSLKNAQSVGNLSNVKTNGLSKGRSYRKPFGCAVLDLSKLLQETSVTVNPSDAGTEHVMPIFVPAQENDFHQLHEHIIESKTNKLFVPVCIFSNFSSKHPRADSINVNFKVFHGDKADKVVQSNPTILHAVSRTNRIGFNDAPVRSRSDIFITIGKATNTGGILRSFTGPGYVSVSAEVRLSDHPETVVERCIFRGTGPEDGESTYESYIVGNPNDPLWEEKFKLSISEDVGGRALLVFKFNFVRPSNYVEDYTSEPDPPVAIAVLKLSTNGRFLRDGEHRMKIRRLEPMSSFDEQLAMYLQEDVVLPTISDAVMSLDTFLCSTRFTEDSTLHSLLKWKQDIGNLNTAEGKFRIKEILRKFTFVSEIEILKVLFR